MKGIIASLAALAMLVACGGGSSSGTTTIAGAQGIATSGTITAFGSVYVNGVRYDVSAASLRKNGRAVAQSALSVGEVALVRGERSAQGGQGVAHSVDVEDNVIGPIASVDAGSGTITVLGQTVLVTASTSFGKGITPADLTGLATGDAIEVSGFADATGAITATRIGRAEAGDPLQVLGKVAGFDGSNHLFQVNGLTVDFATASVTGFTSGAPANDDLVIVRGSAFDATAVQLTATTVMPADTDPRHAEDGEHAQSGAVELEGLVMNFNSATDFEVDGGKVTTHASTVFEGGTVADLANGLRVEVHGTLDANQVLVADRIEIRRIAAVELESVAANVDAANSKLQVLGVTVNVDANTRFEDRSSAQVQMFTLADVTDGDTLEVRGYENPAGSGQVLATRLERLPPSTTVELRGPYMATTPPQFTILGVVVDASGASFGHGEDGDSHGMASGDFYTQAVGKIVEVRGSLSGTSVSATEVRIESEEDR
jgi:hypothetical protein